METRVCVTLKKFALVSIGEEELKIPSRLVKIGFEHQRSPDKGIQ